MTDNARRPAKGETILFADVSAAEVAAVRDRYPFLPDRR